MRTNAKEYFKKRLYKGGDCKATSQLFIYGEAAKTVTNMAVKEQFDKAIHSIETSTCIKGIKGLCSKENVIEILNRIKYKNYFK